MISVSTDVHCSVSGLVRVCARARTMTITLGTCLLFCFLTFHVKMWRVHFKKMRSRVCASNGTLYHCTRCFWTHTRHHENPFWLSKRIAITFENRSTKMLYEQLLFIRSKFYSCSSLFWISFPKLIYCALVFNIVFLPDSIIPSLAMHIYYVK